MFNLKYYNTFINESEDLNKYNDSGQIDNYYVYKYDNSGKLEPVLRYDPSDGYYKEIDEFNNPTKYSSNVNRRKFLSKMFYEENHVLPPNKIWINNKPIMLVNNNNTKYLWDADLEIFAAFCPACKKYLKVESFYGTNFNQCKNCQKQNKKDINAKLRIENPEKLKEINRLHYIKNKDSILSAEKKRNDIRKSDVEKYKLFQKERYKQKMERLKQDPEKYAEYLKKATTYVNNRNEKLKKDSPEEFAIKKEKRNQSKKERYKNDTDYRNTILSKQNAYFNKLKSDPEKHEKYLKQKRDYYKLWKEKYPDIYKQKIELSKNMRLNLRQTPKEYEKYLEKARIIQKRYRDKLKVDFPQEYEKYKDVDFESISLIDDDIMDEDIIEKLN